MSSLLATLAANTIVRLNVGSGGAEPTSAQIQQFLRDAARELWGELPPVQQQTLTVSNLFTAPISALETYYVTYSNGETLLRGSEWNQQDTVLTFKPGGVGKGDTVTAYYLADPGITDSTTVLDSSCIFGPDWLQPLMLLRGEMEVHARLMNVANTEGRDFHASMYRVKQADLDGLKAGRRLAWDRWQARMDASVQARLITGDGIYREAGGSNFKNDSRIINRIFR